MQISRSGPTPAFYDYVTSKALLPTSSVVGHQSITSLGVHEWVEIPRYQRGISWEVDNVVEFLDSSSVLLGNVILAQFPKGVNQNLPPNVNVYLVLVDGLQRFAVGTMLLALLHELVLSNNALFNSSRAHLFTNLIARVFPLSSVYLHNDLELRNHARSAIANQYMGLRTPLENYIKDQLMGDDTSVKLANIIETTFLSRQIAMDIYFNFSSQLSIMSTFLGINTVRVDLGPVDLLRAQIIEKGASSGWSSVSIDEVENDFTDVFTSNEKPDPSLLPFVNVVLRTLRKNGRRVFPSWDGDLKQKEVDDFLDFVQSFKNPSVSNGYYQEIRECGHVPLAILLSYYYTQFVQTKQKPAFLSVSDISHEDVEMQQFLIACYRVLLEGKIGRTRTYAEDILDGYSEWSLSEVSDRMSNQFINKSIAEPLDRQWLTAVVNRLDKNRSKRIFNAMLLSEKSLGFGVQPYTPLVFGRATANFNVDHLIPQSQLTNFQVDEGETLRNFAPLPSGYNRTAKSTPCSSKLDEGGIYENYITAATHPIHPYCEWLTKIHAKGIQTLSDLDRPEFLEPNRNPDIGTQRIDKIVDVLIDRI